MKFSLAAIALVLFTQLAFGQGKNLTVGFYNIENLYDTINDPAVDDEEFLPQGKNQWNAFRYRTKLARLEQVINNLGGAAGPDVLGLCEVENEAVVKDLVNTGKLRKKGYGIAHAASNDKRGVDVSLIYSKKVFKPYRVSQYRVLMEDTTFRTRDFMLVSGKVKKDTLHFLVNHFPSRRGGEEVSEVKRVAVATRLRAVVDSLLKLNSNAKIIIMGDFNDEPDNSSIKVTLHAQTSQDSLQPGDMFNAMGPLKRKGEGSYNYQSKWNMLDQFIISQGLLKKGNGVVYDAGSATIYKPEWLQEKTGRYAGSPYRTYAGAKYLGGYSDHFPVYIHLK